MYSARSGLVTTPRPRPLAKVELMKTQYSSVPLAVQDEALAQALFAGVTASLAWYLVVRVSGEHIGLDSNGNDRRMGE